MSDMEPLAAPPFVSVIIPVYADDGGVARTLTALRAQDYPADCFEVLLIDNGRNPDFSEFTKADARCRVVHEATPGSYAARNTGLKNARGEVLAFTDADCIPAPHWISAGVRVLMEAPECGLAGGGIEFTFQHPGEPSTVELYDSLVNLDQARYIQEEQFSVTANLFTHADIVAAIGPFDAQLRSGGDRDWGNRVSDAGYRLVYVESAIIRHAARSSLAECVVKARRVSGGNVGRLRKRGALRGAPAMLGFFAAGMLPPITQYRQIRHKLLGVSMGRKVSLLVLMTFLKYVRTFEAARVMLGATGQR